MKVYGKKIRFTPRGPWIKGRNSYSLVRDEQDETGVRTQREIEDPRITALTKEYKDAKKGGMPPNKLRDLIELGRVTLYELKYAYEECLIRQLQETPLAAYNTEILQNYIEKKIRVKSGSSKPATITADIAHIKACINALDGNSIKLVEINVIQNILNMQKTAGANLHMLQNFRRLLRFVGRHDEADQLKRKAFKETKPAYLTKKQVEILSNAVPLHVLKKFPLLPDLIKLTFNLGTRISETLALTKSCVRRADGCVVIVVSQQWVRRNNAKADGSDRLRETKNRTVRAILPIDIDETLNCLERFLKMHPAPGEEREPYRWAIDRYIRTACKNIFAINLEYSESNDYFNLDGLSNLEDSRDYKAVHMLRASHAIHMMSLTQDNSAFVAKQLGDTEDVVRKHYSGKTNRAASIGEVSKLIKKSR
jgi:integrase